MLLEINFTLVLFAISFLMFIYLLNLTLYKPVGKVIEARKTQIDGEYAKAKELTKTANELLEAYKSKIKTARHETQVIVNEAIKLGQKKRGEKISLLMDSLIKEKDIALKQMYEEKEAVMKQLQSQLKTLTDLITSKVLGMGNMEKDLVGTH